MSSYTQIYWLTRLDYLQGAFIALSVVSGIILLLYWIGWFANGDFGDLTDKEFKEKYGGKAKAASIVMPIAILIACMIPTRNEMLVIMGGGSVMEYVKKDTSLQKVPYQATEIISRMLDEKIQELKNESKNK